jgi:hypothetical protein
MTVPRKRVGSGRPAEKAALRAVEALFDDANHIYQPITGSNDIGKDAVVDIVIDGETTGDLIALQIKGGASYRRSRGYAIPCSAADRELWRSSAIPVFGIVHDTGHLFWTNLTAWARTLSSDARPASAPVDASFRLDERGLPSFLRQAHAYLRADGPPALLDLVSTDPLRQRAAVIDAFGLGRHDPRPLLLLRGSLRFMRDHAVLVPAIRILTLTVGHGDIFWTPDNWLSKPICDAVRRELRWSVDEVEQLIVVAELDGWWRGGLGQDVHALLDADPNVDVAIERVYITTPNDEVALRCMLILIDAAQHALAEMTRLIGLRPALAADDLAIELRRQLEEDNVFRLWA